MVTVTTLKTKFILGLSILSLLTSCKKTYTCSCSAATQTNGFNTFSDTYTIKERKENDAISNCAKKSTDYDYLIGTQQSYGTVLFVSCNIN